MGLISKNVYEDDVKNREEYGAAKKVSSVLKIPLPEFVPQYKQLSRINIVPFKIGSKNHQRVVNGKAKIGDYSYVFIYFKHTGIGPLKQECVCMKDTFGLPCKLCDSRWAARDAGDTKLEDSLKTKKRSVYVVQDLNSEDPHELKFMDVSSANFTRELDGEAGACVDGAPVVSYADELLEGKVVAFRAVETPFGKFSFPEYKSFKFIDREEEESVTMDVIHKAPSIDQYLVRVTPEQVDAMIFGDLSEDDGDPEVPPAETKPEPVSKKPTTTPTPAVEEVVEKKDPPKGGGKECPNGMTFGASCDTKPKLCQKCPVYDACFAASI